VALVMTGAATTTVIVVRHAEKAAQPAADPPLTDAGVARSKALEAALRDAGVTAIVTTQLERTKATARPLADALHITPEVVPTETSVQEHVKKVVAAVLRHGGGVVLVVGHSNTVPEIVEALGGKKPAAMCDDEYDGLYMVVVSGTGPAHVVHSRYAAASVLGPGCASMR
jgi:phosphohistidine phosphatase SixA